MMDKSSLYEAARSGAVFKKLVDWTVLKVSGPDAASFLQGQSSNDVKALKDGEGQLNAFLDPKAKIRALAYVYRLGGIFYLILEKVYSQELFEHLEKYIIMDDVELVFEEGHLTLVAGPQAWENLGQKTSYKDLAVTERDEQIIFNVSLTAENDSFVLGDYSAGDLRELDDESYTQLRMEAGVLVAGQDYDQSTLLPETGYQAKAVSYTKGCFVGQEIVARVKYRGSVNKLLTGLIFDDEAPEEGVSLETRGKKAGSIKSLAYSEKLSKKIAIASLLKNYRKPGGRFNFEVDGQVYKATVTQLPFYQTASDVEKAQELYNDGIVAFAKETAEGESEATKLLRQAIHKDPKFADAYEVLGVILSRQERYDEAIELMKQLKELTPDEVMSYTNLSLFYMKKGLIKEAEDEKQEATLATFRKAAAERKERLNEEKLAQEQRAEIERKMDMFNQVLEIDEEDLVANFGLGKAYLDLKQAEKALPFLEKCILLKKNYSLAYQYLAQAEINLNHVKKAKSTLNTGIHHATENGDLMPLSEMKRLMTDLAG